LTVLARKSKYSLKGVEEGERRSERLVSGLCEGLQRHAAMTTAGAAPPA